MTRERARQILEALRPPDGPGSFALLELLEHSAKIHNGPQITPRPTVGEGLSLAAAGFVQPHSRREYSERFMLAPAGRRFLDGQWKQATR